MPIPHQNTKEFFTTLSDFSLFEQEISQNPRSIDDRINELSFIISLIDSAFDRDNNDESTVPITEDSFPHNQSSQDNVEYDFHYMDANDENEEASDNSNNIDTINKITEPDEASSEDDFDDIVDLSENTTSNQEQTERNENSNINMTYNQADILNLLRRIQRIRSQQRIDEQNADDSD